eukprot:CAMPEP_0113612024 /NCGR_PEP_ID=MMETSP0017_2-20120614/5877_1 /TAXON_ID=2856 /ORGANISM="Cylindrotheca closterium" /LENGTH=451 /DNA_ID=CAMNT_0000521027 /DNA_START=386 /DNA_END=1738 /DNA_ORIENTATION=- /assembly_acc=CAM_ASM_000147
MERGGNKRINAIFEGNLGKETRQKKPTPKADMIDRNYFCFQKYIKKAYCEIESSNKAKSTRPSCDRLVKQASVKRLGKAPSCPSLGSHAGHNALREALLTSKSEQDFTRLSKKSLRSLSSDLGKPTLEKSDSRLRRRDNMRHSWPDHTSHAASTKALPPVTQPSLLLDAPPQRMPRRSSAGTFNQRDLTKEHRVRRRLSAGGVATLDALPIEVHVRRRRNRKHRSLDETQHGTLERPSNMPRSMPNLSREASTTSLTHNATLGRRNFLHRSHAEPPYRSGNGNFPTATSSSSNVGAQRSFLQRNNKKNSRKHKRRALDESGQAAGLGEGVSVHRSLPELSEYAAQTAPAPVGQKMMNETFHDVGNSNAASGSRQIRNMAPLTDMSINERRRSLQGPISKPPKSPFESPRSVCDGQNGGKGKVGISKHRMELIRERLGYEAHDNLPIFNTSS